MWGPCVYAAVCSLKTELANDRRAYGLKYRVFARIVAALLVHTTVNSRSSGVHKFFKSLEAILKFWAPEWWYEAGGHTEGPEIIGATRYNLVVRNLRNCIVAGTVQK
jgi:hypothetical protein